MNNLLRYVALTPLLAGLSACMPTPEPVKTPPTSTTGAPAMNSSAANRVENTATPAPTPRPMTPDEQEAVNALKWLNGANAANDASLALAKAKALGGKPTLMVFVRRGLSYPGLNPQQLRKIRRKVNDKIVEGSGDMIFGPTHRDMRQKLRVYAVTYNQAIAAGLQ